jgi:hypothetical protein
LEPVEDDQHIGARAGREHAVEPAIHSRHCTEKRNRKRDGQHSE